MRTQLLAVLVAALALSALLAAGGASAQRAARQGNENASGASKSKRVVGVRSSDTGSGSRVTITADDTLKDYSAYRSGDRFYVVLPKSAAGARGGGAGRGYSDMQVQQRGDSVVLSYRVRPGAKPRVEQKFNRLDVVFDVAGEGGQTAAASSAARPPQPQQPPPPAGNRTAAAPQNNPTQAAGANPVPERRQPTAEETARTQAANAAATHATQPAANAGQTSAGAEPSIQNPPPPVEQTQEPAPAATPAAEPQLAQAQPPAPITPITTNQPAAVNQTGTSLGTFVARNGWLAVVLAVVVIGLGLVFAARRTAAAAPAPVEGLGEGSAARSEETRAARAKDVSAKALKDASAAAKASTLHTAKASAVVAPEPASTNEPITSDETVGTKEAASTSEPVKTAEVVKAEEASGADLKPLAAATALAGGEAVSKSRKQSRKEARRKKKDARAEAPAAEATVATPAVEEQTVAAPAAREPAVEEAVAAPVAETAEPAETEVAEPSLETVSSFDAPEVEAAGTATVEAEPAEPVVAETETHARVVEREPAFAPEPERVLDETRHLLEGEEYDRAVVGSRDAMTRQMVAAELLSAIAGRNAPRRERASAAFVEHGYFEEAARDLREADAPAERSAAARAFAHLGDRGATPLLVAALEDPVTDVRRAAVEALGALRDPSAVAALEALLERERTERNRIPPRLIRNAVDSCREGFAEASSPETYEAAPSSEPEAAQVEATAPVGVEPAGETAASEETALEAAAVENAPEPVAEVSAPEVAEETEVSGTPFVPEPAEEPLIAPEPAAEATGETAHVPEPFQAEETFETFAESGVEPYVEPERPHAGLEEEPAEAHESGQVTLFDAAAEEAAREVEAAASKESAPSGSEVAEGDWFDFDMGEMGGETRPAAATPATSEPVEPEPVFESSSGETFKAPAAVEAEEAAAEPTPVVAPHAETTGEIEVADAAEEAPDVREPAPFAREAREKGLAPFDEYSTVPASIQQRIASGGARERAAAIVELSHVDTDEAFQQICAAFDDDAREVRAAAARALYELRADRAESFTRALREASPERRREIGASIASSGLAAESIAQLTGESRDRTYEAFSLLFLMAKAGEVQPLLRAIEGHPSNEVRLAVVKLLALSGQKEVLPAFRRLAVRGSLPTEVRSAVMEAIYQISSSQPTNA